jgi:hypothetical protein
LRHRAIGFLWHTVGCRAAWIASLSMKTNVGKVLSVVTAVASVLFLGFVSVAVFGGPNWEAEARKIEGFTFTRTPATESQSAQWTVTKHVGTGNFQPSRAIEPVMVAALNDKLNEERTELQDLEARISPLEQQIAAANTAITADLAALDARVKELEAALADKRAQVQATAEQVEMKAIEVQKVEARIEARREDVLRLAAEVEELRVDNFRIQQIQQQLQDLIQQLDASLESTRRRHDQLDARPYNP